MDLHTAKNNYFKPYWCFAVFRIILVFVPQLGYIHPDEFFQSIEVFASDTFEFNANVPWDFNVTFPIRSVGITYFTIGLGYKILKTIDVLLKINFNITIVTSYVLVVTPRLFICLLSFLADYSMYRICITNNEKYKSRLLILATSYIMIIFGTRTFSNTTELIFFSGLLYYVSESMIFSNVIVKQQEYLTKRHSKSKSPTERAKFHKLKLYLAAHNLRNVLIISTITVLGFFNRPTFLGYAVLPIFFWLYRGLGFKSVNSLLFHLRIITMLLCAMPTILFLVLIDSFYFGYISWGEIGMLDVSIKNFVLPSFNFIKYNLEEKNLEQHGLHPKFLHLCVNVPLLFNILGIYAFIGFGDIIYKLTSGKYHLLPSVRSIKGLMILSLVTPLLLLSVLSHQEPRFIIPLIFPMIYLYAPAIYDESKNEFVEAKGYVKWKFKVSTTFRFNLWLSLNLIFVLIYGFVHQGGVYPVTNYFARELNDNPQTQYHIFTGFIYNIPQSLLLQTSPDKLYFGLQTKYQLKKRVFLYEEGSKDLNVVFRNLDAILNVSRTNVSSKVFFVAPSSLSDEIRFEAENLNLTFDKIVTFYPHLSTEALPDFKEFLHFIVVSDIKSVHFEDICKCLTRIVNSFGLTIFRVTSLGS